MRRIPSCGTLQAACKSIPENQLIEKCSSGVQFRGAVSLTITFLSSHLLPIHLCRTLPSEHLWSSCCTPLPSPLVADSAKGYSTSTRMLPVSPPIKETPLEGEGVSLKEDQSSHCPFWLRERKWWIFNKYFLLLTSCTVRKLLNNWEQHSCITFYTSHFVLAQVFL